MVRNVALTLLVLGFAAVAHAAPTPKARSSKRTTRAPAPRAAKGTTTTRGTAPTRRPVATKASKSTRPALARGKRRLGRLGKRRGPPAVSFTPCSASVPNTAPAPITALSGGMQGFVVERRWMWPNGATLNVHFMDGTPEARRAVAEVAKQWTKYANLKFKFFFDPNKPPKQTHIRIEFDYGGCNSTLGTSSSYLIDQGESSMKLCHIDTRIESDFFQRAVLHEFGHALGLHHEHQNPKAKIAWNKPYVYDYYGQTQGWDRAYVDNWVFRQIDPTLVSASEWDPLSVMHYAIPKEFTTNGVEVTASRKLSATDKEFMAKTYPKPKSGKPKKPKNSKFYERRISVRNTTKKTVDVRLVRQTRKGASWQWAPSDDPADKAVAFRLAPGQEQVVPGGLTGRRVRFVAQSPDGASVWSANRAKSIKTTISGGYLERQLQTYVVAIEGAPDAPKLSRDKLYTAADAALAAGKYAKARAHYEEFVRRFGKDALTPWAKLGIASSWIDQRRYREALLASYALITDYPDNEATAYAWFYGGVASLNLGKCTDARAYFDFVADPKFGLPKSWQDAAGEFITAMKSNTVGKCG